MEFYLVFINFYEGYNCLNTDHFPYYITKLN